MGYEWAYAPNGFGRREDDFSWQGSHKDDPLLFIRRSKDEPEILTDLNIGGFDETQAAGYLADLLRWSGSICKDKLIVTTVAERSEQHGLTVAKFDRVTRIVKTAVTLVGLRVQDARLIEDGARWNARFDLSDMTDL